jgi:hypothetical protein
MNQVGDVVPGAAGPRGGRIRNRARLSVLPAVLDRVDEIDGDVAHVPLTPAAPTSVFTREAPGGCGRPAM